MIVRVQKPGDYEPAQRVYAQAFLRPEAVDAVPPEVGLFTALWQAGDVIDELSFTAIQSKAGIASRCAFRRRSLNARG